MNTYQSTDAPALLDAGGIHGALRKLLEHVYAEHGLQITRIQPTWGPVSGMLAADCGLVSLEVETSSGLYRMARQRTKVA